MPGDKPQIITYFYFNENFQDFWIYPKVFSPGKPITRLPDKESVKMEYSKKMLIVIAPENFRDEELFEPLGILEENRIEYEIISTDKGRFRGMLGGYATATETISGILQLLEGGKGMKHYGGLMIVGGSGSKDYLWGNEELYTIVRYFDKAKMPIGAICLSPVVLARAGVIAGRHATVWPDKEAVREMEKHKAIYENKPFVSDGRFITANGPTAATEFGKRIAEAFLGEVIYTD